MYRNAFRFFFAPLVVLTALRCALKLLLIDTETGFYTGAPLLPWVFAGLTALAALLTGIAALRAEDPGMPILRSRRPLEAAGFLAAAAIVCISVLQWIALPAEQHVFNVLPKWLRMIEYGLGIASGVFLALIVLWSSLSESAERRGILALGIVCWQALFLIERFISFRQVATVSDQMLEALFWTGMLLFWLAYARCVAGVGANRRRAVALALVCVLLGMPLAAGQIAALAALGASGGPSAPMAALILVMCAYLLCFVHSAIHSPGGEDGKKF